MASKPVWPLNDAHWRVFSCYNRAGGFFTSLSAAALTKMQQLLDEVSCELKYAERLHLKMLSCDYSMDVILPMQDCLHEKFKKKSKKIEVSIC